MVDRSGFRRGAVAKRVRLGIRGTVAYECMDDISEHDDLARGELELDALSESPTPGGVKTSRTSKPGIRRLVDPSRRIDYSGVWGNRGSRGLGHLGARGEPEALRAIVLRGWTGKTAPDDASS